MDIKFTIDTQKNQVRDFMTAMGQNPTIDLQLNLVIEEAKEVLEAAFTLQQEANLENMASFLKESADFLYVMIGSILVAEDVLNSGGAIEQTTTTDTAAFFVEIVERVMSDAHEFLDDDMLVEAFNRVHESNMSKLGEDGKPIYSEEGKVLKGPNYVKPELNDIAVVALERLMFFKEQFEDYTEEDEALAA